MKGIIHCCSNLVKLTKFSIVSGLIFIGLIANPNAAFKISKPLNPTFNYQINSIRDNLNVVFNLDAYYTNASDPLIIAKIYPWQNAPYQFVENEKNLCQMQAEGFIMCAGNNSISADLHFAYIGAEEYIKPPQICFMVEIEARENIYSTEVERITTGLCVDNYDQLK